MSSRRRRVRDKWRSKKWYTVLAPDYFGNVELGLVPADSPEKMIGRVIEATLYDLTGDFAHQYLKIYFQVIEVEGRTAKTIFKGHEYSRDYLRSLVRRRTTRIDGIFTITTKDGYRLRVSACAFTPHRIKTSQEKGIRAVMKEVIERKANELNFDQFVQEAVLGKIASDIYNEAKKIAPLRHVGIRKSKLLSKPPELMAVTEVVEKAPEVGEKST
ncbi:30S ribosomal protein S3ae [Candidatus Bathyarchaeota archaeon]|nr:MAG: 30S ribosomal protein S3ae [Candidatus Bathyarchaeota archaeon]RLG97579.1 MAG: 30S ribosomal protein S3ae [Candidatus Bathyarchaeota archaeon]